MTFENVKSELEKLELKLSKPYCHPNADYWRLGTCRECFESKDYRSASFRPLLRRIMADCVKRSRYRKMIENPDRHQFTAEPFPLRPLVQITKNGLYRRSVQRELVDAVIRLEVKIESLQKTISELEFNKKPLADLPDQHTV